MLLGEIKTLIETRVEICQSEIYSVIKADRGLIDQALSELLAKGIISEVMNPGLCKGCLVKCNIFNERVFRHRIP